MSDTNVLPPSPVPDVAHVTVSDLFAALGAGWQDFKTAPLYGIFFSAVYVLGGFALVYLGAGTVAWVLAVSLGFPLVAPFAAVGLYEVSRRLEAGDALKWSGVLGVVLSEKDRQIPWMGAIIVIYFLFWTFLAHMLFALFMGPSALINPSASLETYLTLRGVLMVVVELVVGGILAFLLFSMTLVSLPLLLDKEIDFVTAMLLSFQVVRQNLKVMLIWAAMMAGLTFIAMLPMFLGLFIVLPILGHATWHLYRRALNDPE
ncbi:MAG: DUF2189 domain-containing protein [Paracoccaceae bacterium]